MQVKLGIAYEGGLDTAYVRALIERILTEKGFSIIGEPDLVKPDTAIVKYVPAFVDDFRQNSIDLMVFVTDKDEEPDRRDQIREAIKKVNPGLLDFSAIGVPSPHMEQWILADDTAVKNVYGLRGSDPLPFGELKPKEQLMSIHKTSSFEGTFDDAKVRIAQECNFSIICSKAPEFNLLHQDISTCLNFIQTQSRA